MGSVKDLETVREPTRDRMGVGRFHFSDRYSVFDWGEMPDHIDRKGAALCLMGAYCFERLGERGVRTHYRGLVAEDGRVVKLDEADKAADTIEIELVNVYRPNASMRDGKLHYDYGRYSPSLRNYLIPLEIIYRNGLPEGSSVFKRLRQGQTTLEELGLNHQPRPGERLSKPMFDVSTKLEERDRYLSWSEAREIAGLTSEEVGEVKDLLMTVNSVITQAALKAGLENEDGKIELAFNPDRRLMVVDVVGTLDECRFTYKGLDVSKEIARQFYRRTVWFRDVEEAKRTAEAQGTRNWRKLCRSSPPRLDPALKRMMGDVYMAVSDEVTEKRLFDVPSLAETVEKYRRYVGHA